MPTHLCPAEDSGQGASFRRFQHQGCGERRRSGRLRAVLAVAGSPDKAGDEQYSARDHRRPAKYRSRHGRIPTGEELVVRGLGIVLSLRVIAHVHDPRGRRPAADVPTIKGCTNRPQEEYRRDQDAHESDRSRAAGPLHERNRRGRAPVAADRGSSRPPPLEQFDVCGDLPG